MVKNLNSSRCCEFYVLRKLHEALSFYKSLSPNTGMGRRQDWSKSEDLPLRFYI